MSGRHAAGRSYPYVGPAEILARVAGRPAGQAALNGSARLGDKTAGDQQSQPKRSFNTPSTRALQPGDIVQDGHNQ